MKTYASLIVFLLLSRVSAWNRCYCTGSNQNAADKAANTCCTSGDGVTFPRTRGDVLGRWDSRNKVCVFSGRVLSQNTASSSRDHYSLSKS
ncbi:hypothetical protein FOMA001_g17023 [Fusarium oxysporum f. sp. matthiolae]|nr:hypothetical protein FOMA001_g17023 [Fusarium oxysporum f. sp. matthiolae]